MEEIWNDENGIEWKHYDGKSTRDLCIDPSSKKGRAKICAAFGVAKLKKYRDAEVRIPSEENIIRGLSEAAICLFEIPTGKGTDDIKESVKQDVQYAFGKASTSPHSRLIDATVINEQVVDIRIERCIKENLGCKYMGELDERNVMDLHSRIGDFVENGIPSNAFQKCVDKLIAKNLLPEGVRTAGESTPGRAMYKAVSFMAMVSGITYYKNVGEPNLRLDITRRAITMRMMGWDTQARVTRDVMYITKPGVFPRECEIVSRRDDLFTEVRDGSHAELWLNAPCNTLVTEALVTLGSHWLASHPHAAVVVEQDIFDRMPMIASRFGAVNVIGEGDAWKLDDISCCGIPSQINDALTAIDIHEIIHQSNLKKEQYKSSVRGRLNDLVIPYARDSLIRAKGALDGMSLHAM